MANPEKSPAFEKDQVQFDSLNMDIVEPTDVVVDKTVRPMPDSLRKWLKLPPYDKPPEAPPQEKPPSDR
jgi:hypothetical protein